jgi:hypothetical protein
MARDETKDKEEYQPLATNSEALWALIAVIAMTVAMEIYQWV